MTAGVFLLIRASPLFDVVPLILIIISIVGVLTVFIAGTIGLVQNDLKKIIAYSTCSQLGYMVVACGPKGSVRTEKWSTIKTSYLIKYFSERCRIANGCSGCSHFNLAVNLFEIISHVPHLSLIAYSL